MPFFLAPLLAKPAIGLVFGFFRKFWPYIMVALLLLGVYLYWKHLTNTIADQAATIRRQEQVILALEQKVKTCEANYNGLKGSLDTQNQSLAKLQKLLKDNQGDWKMLTDKLKADNVQLDAKLKNILKEPKPETCEAAIKYLLDARKEYIK